MLSNKSLNHHHFCEEPGRQYLSMKLNLSTSRKSFDIYPSHTSRPVEKEQFLLLPFSLELEFANSYWCIKKHRLNFFLTYLIWELRDICATCQLKSFHASQNLHPK